MNERSKKIIVKWYKTLEFPERLDGEFYASLDKYDIDPDIKFADYNLSSCDGKRNLFSFLIFAEELSEKYKAKGIPERILLDSLHDLVIWTEKYTEIKGELYLGELDWLKHMMNMVLFRLGSLQFCYATTSFSIPSHGVTPGDYVLHIHIPTGASLKQRDVSRSMRDAIDFFGEYYPEAEYKCFTCHSWMLDSKLTEILPEGSNILAFRNRFDIISEDARNLIIKFIFPWDTTEENLKDKIPTSSLSRAVKERVLSGEKMNVTLGAIRKEDVLNYTLD